MVSIVAIGHTESTGTTAKDSTPVACSHLFWCSLEGIIAGSSLCITISCEVVLKLNTSKEVVLTKCYVHLIGNHGILCLSQVTIGEDITRQSPCGIVVLTIGHQDFDNRSSVTIFSRTGLVLERISTTQSIVNLTEL